MGFIWANACNARISRGKEGLLAGNAVFPGKNIRFWKVRGARERRRVPGGELLKFLGETHDSERDVRISRERRACLQEML